MQRLKDYALLKSYLFCSFKKESDVFDKNNLMVTFINHVGKQ